MSEKGKSFLKLVRIHHQLQIPSLAKEPTKSSEGATDITISNTISQETRDEVLSDSNADEMSAPGESKPATRTWRLAENIVVENSGLYSVIVPEVINTETQNAGEVRVEKVIVDGNPWNESIH